MFFHFRANPDLQQYRPGQNQPHRPLKSKRTEHQASPPVLLLPPLSSIYPPIGDACLAVPPILSLPPMAVTPPLARSSTLSFASSKPIHESCDLSLLQDLASAALSLSAYDGTVPTDQTLKRKIIEDEQTEFCARCGKGGPARRHKSCAMKQKKKALRDTKVPAIVA